MSSSSPLSEFLLASFTSLTGFFPFRPDTKHKSPSISRYVRQPAAVLSWSTRDRLDVDLVVAEAADLSRNAAIDRGVAVVEPDELPDIVVGAHHGSESLGLEDKDPSAVDTLFA